MLNRPLFIATISAGLSVMTVSTPASADPVAGAIVGGAIGAAAGGPPGAAIGAILGTAIGADVQHHEYGYGYAPSHYGERYYAPPPHYAPPAAYSYYESAPVYYGRVFAPAYYPPRVVYAPPRYVYAPPRHYHGGDPRHHARRYHRDSHGRYR